MRFLNGLDVLRDVLADLEGTSDAVSTEEGDSPGGRWGKEDVLN